MEIFERVKAVRKHFSLTRKEFAAKLGVSESVIVNIELNRLKNPEQKDPLLNLLCSTFGISKDWLRTGEGEMLVKAQANSAADRFAAAYPEMTETDKALLEAYFALTEAQREVFLQYCLKVSEAYRAASGASGASAIDAEVAAYRADLEAETEAAEKSEASPATGGSTSRREA